MKIKKILAILTFTLALSCENGSVDDYIYGSLSGTVKDITGETAISGASVTTSPGSSITTTNTDGVFNIGNLQEGQYALIIEKDGYVKSLSNIYIMPGKTAQLDITLESKTDSYGVISGIIKNEDGTVLPNIQISTTPGTNSVYSGTNGEYTISNIPTGDYIITAKSNSNYLENNASVSIRKGETSTANFIMVYNKANNISPVATSNPTPANNSINISTSISLSWEGSDPNGDSLTYDLYLWADGSTFSRLANNIKSGTYNLSSALTANTIYYWFIVARDPFDGVSVSPVWKFTTAP